MYVRFFRNSSPSDFVLDGKEIMPDMHFYCDPVESEKEESKDAAVTQEYSAPAEQIVDFTAAPDVQK